MALCELKQLPYGYIYKKQKEFKLKNVVKLYQEDFFSFLIFSLSFLTIFKYIYIQKTNL